MLVAAILQAAYFIMQKPLFPHYRPLELTCYAIWGGTLMSLVFLPGLATALRAAPLQATLAVVYLGVFPAALAYLALAIRVVPPARRAGDFFRQFGPARPRFVVSPRKGTE